MRDSMRFGRLLGEAAAPAIDDPARLDRTLVEVERDRDRECMASYHWGNRESRIMPVTPLLLEALRDFSRPGRSDLMDMFDRRSKPHHVLNPLRGAKLGARAALRRGTDRRALLREMAEELRLDAGIWREELARPFRPTRVWPTERPGFEVPGSPRESDVAAATSRASDAPGEPAAPPAVALAAVPEPDERLAAGL
jgi:hypothetical protein